MGILLHCRLQKGSGSAREPGCQCMWAPGRGGGSVRLRGSCRWLEETSCRETLRCWQERKGRMGTRADVTLVSGDHPQGTGQWGQRSEDASLLTLLLFLCLKTRCSLFFISVYSFIAFST